MLLGSSWTSYCQKPTVSTVLGPCLYGCEFGWQGPRKCPGTFCHGGMGWAGQELGMVLSWGEPRGTLYAWPFLQGLRCGLGTGAENRGRGQSRLGSLRALVQADTDLGLLSLLSQEIFGPVLTVYVYPDDKYRETLQLVDSTTSYGLTGAVFAQDK